MCSANNSEEDRQRGKKLGFKYVSASPRKICPLFDKISPSLTVRVTSELLKKIIIKHLRKKKQKKTKGEIDKERSFHLFTNI